MGCCNFRDCAGYNILKPSSPDRHPPWTTGPDSSFKTRTLITLAISNPEFPMLWSSPTLPGSQQSGCLQWMYPFPTENLNCIWIILGYCHLVFLSSLTVNNPLSLYGYLEYIYRGRLSPLSLLLCSRWLPCWREANGEESCILPPLKNKATQI